MFSCSQMRGMLYRRPDAQSAIAGGPGNPDLRGTVSFYQVAGGALVMAEIVGLPQGEGVCAADVFGFHIHEGSCCSGTAEDPFADAGSHYDLHGCPHPAHAGDLPPLFGNGGYAFMAVFTDRFRVQEVIGRTVIIHSSPDDFTTQPSGNSGTKIACGQILRVQSRELLL